MIKNVIKIIAGVALAATLLPSCSKDHDDDNLNSQLTKGTDQRPSWTVPADLYMRYEYTMSVEVIPQETLLSYLTDDDMMCATVDGEIRAVSTPHRNGGQTYFPLVIAGTSNSGAVSLSYYCARLSRIYTLNAWQPFNPGLAPLQDDQPYVIHFITEQL